MKCSLWESQIALYVAGDLKPVQAARLELHLSSCPACRNVLTALHSSQQTIQELRSEATDVSRVHASVMDGVRMIEAQRTRLDRFEIWLWNGFQWRYAVLGIIAVLVAFGSFRLVSPLTVNPPLVAIHQAPVPVAEAPQLKVEQVQVPRKHLRPKAHPVDMAADSAAVNVPDTVVQLQTDDPNVVIYWLIERKGSH